MTIMLRHAFPGRRRHISGATAAKTQLSTPPIYRFHSVLTWPASSFGFDGYNNAAGIIQLKI